MAIYGFLSVANCLFWWKPQICKLCCHHTLQEESVGWFALSPRFAHRFPDIPWTPKMVQKGQNPQGSPPLSWTGLFFLLRGIGSNGNGAVVTAWLCLMTRGRAAPLSWLPIPRKCTSAWLLSPKESHVYWGNLLFINLTWAQRAAQETDFFNQIVHFWLNGLVSTPFLFLSCCTGAICV